MKKYYQIRKTEWECFYYRGTSCQHYLAVHRMGSISWIEGAETTGSSGSYTFWKLYRYTERSRILFCQSILYQCKPCFQDKVESEWRC